MVAFPFLLFGLVFAAFKLLSENWSGKVRQGQQSLAESRRNNFIRSIQATDKDKERVGANASYADVVDDISYIQGIDYDEISIKNSCKSDRTRYFLPCRLTWREAVENIRLSRIGKTNTEPGSPLCNGVSIMKQDREYENVKRYYEVLARNFSKTGILTIVTERDTHDKSWYVRINLSKFDEYYY